MTTWPFSDPFLWFLDELQKAVAQKIPEPNAMQLATVSPEGFPSVRTVLFKGFVRGGFGFYTNYESPKARDLQATQKAALNFFWPTLETQIRVEGPVDLQTRAESEDYFKTRARLSQLGAWASHQSSEIPNLDWLEKRVAEFEEKFRGQDIPCPPNWGGFRLVPLRFEFWYGRQGRLHERYIFERSQESQPWRTFMKSP